MSNAPLIKKTNWAEELAAFFDAAHDAVFCYGVTDCCLFAGNGIKAMTGVDLMAPYRERYKTEEDIKKIIADEKASCLTSLVRRTLKEAGLQVKDTLFAMRGDIALLDEGALGLVAMDGRSVVALHPERGTHHLPLNKIKILWGIE